MFEAFMQLSGIAVFLIAAYAMLRLIIEQLPLKSQRFTDYIGRRKEETEKTSRGDRHKRAYFTKEIEVLLQETLNTQLAATDAEEIGANVRLNNTPTGKLEIWWEEKRYTDIDALPNAELRRALHAAIRRWEES
jgi:hypothetical protein